MRPARLELRAFVRPAASFFVIPDERSEIRDLVGAAAPRLRRTRPRIERTIRIVTRAPIENGEPERPLAFRARAEGGANARHGNFARFVRDPGERQYTAVGPNRTLPLPVQVVELTQTSQQVAGKVFGR